MSEGFRNNIAQVCKILELNLFDVSLRIAPGKLKTVTTCNRFIYELSSPLVLISGNSVS